MKGTLRNFWKSFNAIPAVGIVVVTKLSKGEEVPEVHKFVWLANFQGGNSHLSSPFYNPEGLE